METITDKDYKVVQAEKDRNIFESRILLDKMLGHNMLDSHMNCIKVHMESLDFNASRGKWATFSRTQAALEKHIYDLGHIVYDALKETDDEHL